MFLPWKSNMIEELLEKIVRDKLRVMGLTDKITSFLVKKKRRGTFQALEESRKIEKELTENVVTFVREWMTNETIDGFIKKALDSEIKSQVQLELSGKGFFKVEV